MKKNAFTLVEILITVMIATILFTGLMVLLNPLSLVQKGNNITRKKDLDDAKKALEQYMDDTGCYPQPTQVCTDGNNNPTCHICTKGQSAKFTYFSKDVCDPKIGSLNYLYQTEKTGAVAAACPKWFRIFSILEGPYNGIDDIWGCKKGGCGVAPGFGYSYLVTSPGAPTDDAITGYWYCYLTIDNRCHQCTPYSNCNESYNPCNGRQLYPSCFSCCGDGHPESCISC